MIAGAPKYVYFFDEGDGGMSALLGGKGSGLAEMTGAGLPVPSGFTITTQACLRLWRIRTFVSAWARRADRGGDGRTATAHRQGTGFGRTAPVGLGAQRRGNFDARHDGHRAKSRAERRNGRSARAADRTTNVSRGMHTGVSSRCSATSYWGSTSERFSDELIAEKRTSGHRARSRCRRRNLETPGRTI